MSEKKVILFLFLVLIIGGGITGVFFKDDIIKMYKNYRGNSLDKASYSSSCTQNPMMIESKAILPENPSNAIARNIASKENQTAVNQTDTENKKGVSNKQLEIGKNQTDVKSDQKKEENVKDHSNNQTGLKKDQIDAENNQKDVKKDQVDLRTNQTDVKSDQTNVKIITKNSNDQMNAENNQKEDKKNQLELQTNQTDVKSDQSNVENIKKHSNGQTDVENNQTDKINSTMVKDEKTSLNQTNKPIEQIQKSVDPKNETSIQKAQKVFSNLRNRFSLKHKKNETST